MSAFSPSAASTELRLTLFRNGYCPLPVSDPNPMLSSGGKAPLFKKWRTVALSATESTITAWPTKIRNHGNTGLLTGKMVGLDLDIPDVDLAAQIAQLADAMIGTTPLVRVGKAPKSLRCYRAETTMAKAETAELVLPCGTVVQIEAMGEGQQIVAYGTHPVTMRPYQWLGAGPDTIPLADLPIVTEAALRGFLAAAEAVLRAAGGRTRKEIEEADKTAEPAPSASTPTHASNPRKNGSNEFFVEVNKRALANIRPWFLALFPKGEEQTGGGLTQGCWRVSSTDLGRGLEEDISVHPTEGGHDFGTGESCSPIDLVVGWGGAPDAKAAAFFLCDKLGIARDDCGWKEPRRKNKSEDSRRLPNEPTAIQVVNGQLAEAVTAGEQALIRAKLGIYQRGQFIVRPGMVRIAVSDNRKVDGQRILVLGESGLMEALTAAAPWEVYDGRSGEWVRKDCPAKVVKALRDRCGRWELPVLSAIINAPTLRPDGSILSTPGYDEATGLLFDPLGAEFHPVPDRPTKADAAAALRVLEGLIETFPFVGEADRSVALSMFLTASIRRSLPTAPLHGFSAPVPGSGKSMLVDLSNIMVTGREAAVIGPGETEAEFSKRLGSQLLAGDAQIAIDNVDEPLGGQMLCQALSQTVMKARILGLSETPELPTNALVTATGNNLTLVGDVTRRAILANLDPKCERPELRKFDRDPIAVMKEGRGRYLAACLTILRAFHVAGRPQQRHPLGSFIDWSRWVRDALIWLGCADPCDTMEFVRQADPKMTQIIAVMSEWHSVIGSERVTGKRLIERATASTFDSWGKPTFSHPDFREALLVVAGAGGAVNSEKLGKWLRENKDRVIAGLRLERAGATNGATTWQLFPA